MEKIIKYVAFDGTEFDCEEDCANYELETKAKEYATGYNDIQIAYRCSINFNDSNGQFVDVKLGQGTNNERFGTVKEY